MTSRGDATNGSHLPAVESSTPSSFHALVLDTFDSLQRQSQIFYAPYENIKHVSTTFPAVFQVAPHLNRKPVLAADAPERRSNNAKVNPFANPDPAFVLPFQCTTHTLMLNKYCVYRPQLLLVTKQYRPQHEALDAGDVKAAWDLMTQLEGEALDSDRPTGSTQGVSPPQRSPRQRWLAFYNCGAEAGSSQGHKHVQVVPRPETHEISFELFPETATSTTTVAANIDSIPHKHFVLRLPDNIGSDAAVEAYNRLLQSMRTFFNEQGWRNHNGVTDPPHNVVFTKDWICLIPRRSSGMERYAMANAMGMIGVFGVTHPAQVPSFTEDWGSLDEHMAYLGFPAD